MLIINKTSNKINVNLNFKRVSFDTDTNSVKQSKNFLIHNNTISYSEFKIALNIR